MVAPYALALPWLHILALPCVRAFAINALPVLTRLPFQDILRPSWSGAEYQKYAHRGE